MSAWFTFLMPQTSVSSLRLLVSFEIIASRLYEHFGTVKKYVAFLSAHVDVPPERVSLLAFSLNVTESERSACSGCSFVFPPCPMWLTLSSCRQSSGTRCPFTVPVSSSLRRGSVLTAKDAETQGAPAWTLTGVYLLPIQVIPRQRNRLTYPILQSDFFTSFSAWPWWSAERSTWLVVMPEMVGFDSFPPSHH